MNHFNRQDFESHIFYKSPFAEVVFGFRFLVKDDFSHKFPQEDFQFIKQIHSNKVICAETKSLVEADGHWTSTKHRALTIQTADCLPIMFVSPQVAMALHAGWRGLESNIIGAGLAQIQEASMNLQGLYAFIGPHISRQYFEVGSDVGKRLDEAAQQAGLLQGQILLSHPNPEKYFVDLALLAQAQLIHAGIAADHIVHVGLDTYSDARFVSYRKTGAAGRQWSFCYLK